jgi:hypothetical protein
MTTDYEKQLEEENISLKNLLDERTKQLDAAKELLMQWENGEMVNKPKFPSHISPGVYLTETDCTTYVTSSNTSSMQSSICLDGQMLMSDDIANLKHLWSLHMQKVNNHSLLYRIWGKIVSCLNTKKN